MGEGGTALLVEGLIRCLFIRGEQEEGIGAEMNFSQFYG